MEGWGQGKTVDCVDCRYRFRLEVSRARPIRKVREEGRRTLLSFEVELDLNRLIPSYLQLILASWLGYPRIVLAPASQVAIVFLK